jgi:hypothetical protein
MNDGLFPLMLHFVCDVLCCGFFYSNASAVSLCTPSGSLLLALTSFTALSAQLIRIIGIPNSPAGCGPFSR